VDKLILIYQFGRLGAFSGAGGTKENDVQHTVFVLSLNAGAILTDLSALLTFPYFFDFQRVRITKKKKQHNNSAKKCFFKV
jgi:hypothetical protein